MGRLSDRGNENDASGTADDAGGAYFAERVRERWVW
jgi:hypothetical protein